MDEEAFYKTVKYEAEQCIEKIKNTFLEKHPDENKSESLEDFQNYFIQDFDKDDIYHGAMFIVNRIAFDKKMKELFKDEPTEFLLFHTKNLFIGVAGCAFAIDTLKWIHSVSRNDIEAGITLLCNAKYYTGAYAGLAVGVKVSRNKKSNAGKSKAKIKLEKEEFIRLKVIELWLAGNPKNNKKWQSYTHGANNIFDHEVVVSEFKKAYPDDELEYRKVYDWIRKYEREIKKTN